MQCCTLLLPPTLPIGALKPAGFLICRLPIKPHAKRLCSSSAVQPYSHHYHKFRFKLCFGMVFQGRDSFASSLPPPRSGDSWTVDRCASTLKQLLPGLLKPSAEQPPLSAPSSKSDKSHSGLPLKATVARKNTKVAMAFWQLTHFPPALQGLRQIDLQVLS